MRNNLAAYRGQQVFLNYPFDEEFEPLSWAMHFAVASAGLIPICAKDLSSPDRPRLEVLVDAIINCRYSAHDFSRFTGEGRKNYARFNMPIEMGMALFNALATQRQHHRCAFFVSTPHDYQAFASDLAGLDPACHDGDDMALLVAVYEWLRGVVPGTYFNSQPAVMIKEKYAEFSERRLQINGSGDSGSPLHAETKELIYRICSECGWWDWRATKMGKAEFPVLPLSFKK